MPMPGQSDENDVKLLLKKLLSSPDEVAKFAVVARGPKDGELILSKKEKLKKKDVQAAAEEEAKKRNGGKAVRVDVMVGECRLHKAGKSTLRLSVYGKAIAKAVSCVDHLLARGPYKSIGFTDVILEEVDESDEETDSPKVETASPKVDAAAPKPSQTPPAGSPEPSADASPDAATQFNQRLAELLPKVKTAAGTAAGDEAKLKMSEAGVFARKKDFEQAGQLLDQAETLLKSSGAAGPTAPTDDAATKITARLKELKPKLDQALTAGTPESQDVKLKSSELGVAVRKKDYELGYRLLDELETMLRKSSTGQAAFAKQWETAKVTWRDFIELVDEQVNQVRGAMLSSGDPQLKLIADRGLPALTNNHKTPVMAALLEIDRAPAGSRGKAAAQAQAAINAFRKHLTSDERIRVLDEESKAAFGVALTIRDSIGKGLDALEEALRPVLAG